LAKAIRLLRNPALCTVVDDLDLEPLERATGYIVDGTL
jgi:hypothetical protein